MYCGNCGNELKENSRFCDECGCPVIVDEYQQNGHKLENAQSSNGTFNIANDNPVINRNPKLCKKNLIITTCITIFVIVGIVYVLAGGNFINLKKRSNGFQFTTDYELYGASFEYMIMTDSDKRYGALDFKGNVIIPFEYEKLEFLDKNENGTMFMAVKDNTCGVLNDKNKTIVDMKYDAIGYFNDYDLIYTIDLTQQDICFFNIKGKSAGKADYSYGTRYIGFNTQFVSNRIIDATTSNASVYDAMNEELTIHGMLSSHCFAFSNNGVLKVVDLSTEREVLNQADNYSLGRLVISDKPEDSYYVVTKIVPKTGYGSTETAYNRYGYIIDSQGNQVDYAPIKDTKGNEVARIAFDEYQYARLLDDSGVCLLMTGEEAMLKNIKTDNVVAKFTSWYYDDDDKILMACNYGDHVNSYTSYSYSGKKLYEYGDLYDRNSLAQVSDENVLFGVGINGLYIGDKVDDYHYNVKFVTANGEVKDIAEESYMLAIHSKGYDYSDIYTGYYAGLQYSGRYIDKYAQYYNMSGKDDRSYLLNDYGNVIADLSSMSNSRTFVAHNDYGVCCQSFGDVYWYNRK